MASIDIVIWTFYGLFSVVLFFDLQMVLVLVLLEVRFLKSRCRAPRIICGKLVVLKLWLKSICHCSWLFMFMYTQTRASDLISNIQNENIFEEPTQKIIRWWIFLKPQLKYFCKIICLFGCLCWFSVFVFYMKNPM